MRLGAEVRRGTAVEVLLAGLALDRVELAALEFLKGPGQVDVNRVALRQERVVVLRCAAVEHRLGGEALDRDRPGAQALADGGGCAAHVGTERRGFTIRDTPTYTV
jgi:hypothetical protein